MQQATAVQPPCVSTCLGEASRGEAEAGAGHQGTNTPLPPAADSACTQYTQLPVPPFVAGGTASIVAQSHASGDVAKTSGLYVGGLVGALEAGSSLIDSYAWGDVTGSGQDSGALIGYAVAGNTLTRVYATGAAERGGLVAIDDGNTSYTACYWHSDKHARAVGSLAEDPAGTFGRSEAELLLQAGYGGYDFVDVWMIEEGVGYAGLR